MALRDYINKQPNVVKMLMNSYHKHRLSHAYLFEGEKGTKKKQIAIEFAKLLYCEQEDACNECINCMRIEHRNHPNVLVIEPDNGTIRKEQVLYLQQEYSRTTLEPGPKIYIIEDIDTMSINASNSILKFIEEPLPDTYTILTTNNLHKILPTIISRCQVMNFRPVPKKEIIDYLINHDVDAHIASVCSELTNDVDDALSIASDEQIGEVIDLVKKIGQALLNQKADPVVLCETHKLNLYKEKKYIPTFLDILLIYMRDIQNIACEDKIVFTEEIPFIKEYAHLFNKEKIIYNINEILQAKISLEYNANSVLLIDHLLISLK